MPKRVISKNERSWPDQRDVGAVQGRDQLGRLGPEHLLGQEAGDGVRDRVVDVEQVELVLARDLGHLRGQRQVVRRVLEERSRSRRRPRGSGCSPGSRPAGRAGGTTRSGRRGPRRASCLPSSAATAPEPPTVRVARDADVHSVDHLVAARPRDRCARAICPTTASPWRASRPITSPSPRSWKRAAGTERVARAAQAVRARLVALLEGAHGLLLQGLDLVERRGRARRRPPRCSVGRGRPAPPRSSPSRCSTASRVRSKADSDLRVGLARPARQHRFRVRLQVGAGRAISASRRAPGPAPRG